MRAGEKKTIIVTLTAALLLLLAIVFVYALTVHNNDVTDARQNVSQKRIDTGAVQPSDAVEGEGSSRVVTPGPAEPGSDGRRGPVQKGVSGIVVDQGGAPIDGATVHSVRLTGSILNESPPLGPESRSEVRASMLDTRTDSTGYFQFPEQSLSRNADKTALWATASGMRASFRLLEPEDADAGQFVRIEMQSGSGLPLRVVDVRGEPVQGATVEYWGFMSCDANRGNSTEDTAAKALLLSSTTDTSGRPNPPLPCAEVALAVQAAKGQAISEIRLISGNPFDDDLSLTLHGLFFCEGEVRLDPGFTVEGPLLVEICSVTGNSRSKVSAGRVRDDLSWGPISVPAVDCDGLEVRLLGKGVVTDSVDIGPPIPNASGFVVLTARAGRSIDVYVHDSGGFPVMGADVGVQWEVQSGVISSWKTSNEQGIAGIDGVPTGAIRLTVKKEGFVPQKLVPFPAAELIAEPIDIELAPALSIHGKVVHGSEPVKDFDVIWWNSSLQDGAGGQTERFTDREDGGFELSGVSAGAVFLLATSDELPRSPTVQVEMSAGEEQEVVLELPDALRVRGQVIDAATGDPVSDAVVQLYANQGRNYISAWGGQVTVDPDGHFDLTGFAEGQNRYTIEAPGYARLLGDTWAKAPGPIDLGVVPLFAEKGLTVVLTGELPEDLSGYSASVVASRYYDPRPFSADGTAYFEGMGPGSWVVHVTMPDGSQVVDDVELAPGRDWIVEVPVQNGPGLDVVVEPDGPGSLPEGLVVTAFLWMGDHFRGRTAPVDDSGHAHLAGVPPGKLVVSVGKAEEEATASSVVEQTPGGATVHVRLSGRSKTFEVLDPLGQPVHGAEVHLYFLDGAVHWYDYGYTDEQGLRTVGGLPDERFFAGIIHPDHGKCFDIPVDLAKAADPMVLQFTRTSELRARLVENGQPRPGVQVRILGGHATYIVGWFPSDAEGIVQVRDLAPGVYDLTVMHPGYWHERIPVSVNADGEVVDAEIHRLTSLTVRAHTVGGSAVSGLAVELEHAELGSVAGWIDDGLVEAPAGGLMTDANGLLKLGDVPRGKYAWHATLADGTVIEGEGEARIGQPSEIEVIVP